MPISETLRRFRVCRRTVCSELIAEFLESSELVAGKFCVNAEKRQRRIIIIIFANWKFRVWYLIRVHGNRSPLALHSTHIVFDRNHSSRKRSRANISLPRGEEAQEAQQRSSPAFQDDHSSLPFCHCFRSAVLSICSFLRFIFWMHIMNVASISDFFSPQNTNKNMHRMNKLRRRTHNTNEGKNCRPFQMSPSY